MYRYDRNLGPYKQIQQWLRRERLIRMRHGCNAQGWLLVAYQGIMAGCVLLVGFFIGFARMVESVAQSGRGDVTVTVEELVYNSGWGYILSCVVGVALLLLWKKPDYFSRTVFKKSRTMGPVRFVQLLSLFMSIQLVSLLLGALTESVLNEFGLTSHTTTGYSADGWSMFFYTALFAPVAEEILFRGVVLRALAPYGKKFAIISTAVLFGLYHGELGQGLFACCAGLVLGYVALEYNVIWAMVLHMFNNLLIADTLPRLSGMLVPEGEKLLLLGVLGLFGIIAMAVLALNYQKIEAYLRRERNEPDCYKAFWSAPGMIVVTVISVLLILENLFSTVAPT